MLIKWWCPLSCDGYNMTNKRIFAHEQCICYSGLYYMDIVIHVRIDIVLDTII